MILEAYHQLGIGFRSANATVTLFSDPDAAVTRLDFTFDHSRWVVGQHYFLCFPALSIWQSHPMTPASVPTTSGTQRHTYIIRARNGQTKQLAEMADVIESAKECITPVILIGPSGRGVLGNPEEQINVLAVAGGTGITFALPIVMEAAKRAEAVGTGAIELVWLIRKTKNVEWILPEMMILRRIIEEGKVNLRIRLYVTRDSRPSSQHSNTSTRGSAEKELEMKPDKVQVSVETTSVQFHSVSEGISETPGFSIEWLTDHHPNFGSAEGLGIIEEWLDRGTIHGGRNLVCGSGVAEMGRDLRVAVAAENNGAKAWRGDDRYAVEFHWDDRFT
jgi:hypothetical protein